MEQKKKPFYKKWWIWLIAFFAVLTIYGAITGVEQARDDVDNAENVNGAEDKTNDEETVETEENTDSTEEESAESEGIQSVTEHDEVFTFGEFTVDSIETEIEDNELTFKFQWINQSGKGATPYTAVGFVDVHQGDEILDEISGAYEPSNQSSILGTNHDGGRLPVTMVYEIVSEEPIRIVFGAMHEIDNSTEELIIELN